MYRMVKGKLYFHLLNINILPVACKYFEYKRCVGFWSIIVEKLLSYVSFPYSSFYCHCTVSFLENNLKILCPHSQWLSIQKPHLHIYRREATSTKLLNIFHAHFEFFHENTIWEWYFVCNSCTTDRLVLSVMFINILTYFDTSNRKLYLTNIN